MLWDLCSFRHHPVCRSTFSVPVPPFYSSRFSVQTYFSYDLGCKRYQSFVYAIHQLEVHLTHQHNFGDFDKLFYGTLSSIVYRQNTQYTSYFYCSKKIYQLIYYICYKLFYHLVFVWFSLRICIHLVYTIHRLEVHLTHQHNFGDFD